MEITKELKEYIEQNVFPMYQKNDEGYNLDHIKYVIDRSLKFASTIEGINYDMVYTVAAYHDIGHHRDHRNHEKASAEMLLANADLREFFTINQIKEMAMAIYDHRASMGKEPRNIYGKILSSADRNTEIDVTLRKVYRDKKRHSANQPLDEMIEECRQQMIDKYGKNGYTRKKMFFQDEIFQEFLKEILKLANNKEKFKQKFLEVNRLIDAYQTLEYYDQNAEAYFEKTKDVDMQKQYDRFIFYLPEKAYVLDFGCGSGRDSKYFIERGFSVTAVDGSEKMCELASKNIGQPVECMQFDQLRDTARYDGIWACSSILHVEREKLPDILRKMIKALKENGVIFTSFKIGDKCEVRNGRYFNDMTRELLEEMLKDLEAKAEIVEYFENGSAISDDRWGNYYIKKPKEKKEG